MELNLLKPNKSTALKFNITKFVELPDDVIKAIICQIILNEDYRFCNSFVDVEPEWWKFGLSCIHINKVVREYFQENGLSHPREYGVKTCSEHDCPWTINEMRFYKHKFNKPEDNEEKFNVPRLCHTLTAELINNINKYDFSNNIRHLHFESGYYLSPDNFKQLDLFTNQLTKLSIDEGVSDSLSGSLHLIPISINNLSINGLTMDFNQELYQLINDENRSFHFIDFNYSEDNDLEMDTFIPYHNLKFELFTPKKKYYTQDELNYFVKYITLTIMNLNGCQMLNVYVNTSVTTQLSSLQRNNSFNVSSSSSSECSDNGSINSHQDCCIRTENNTNTRMSYNTENCCDMCDNTLYKEEINCHEHSNDIASIIVSIDQPWFSNSLYKILQHIAVHFDVLVHGGIYTEPFTLYVPLHRNEQIRENVLIKNCELLQTTSSLICKDNAILKMCNFSKLKILSIDIEQSFSNGVNEPISLDFKNDILARDVDGLSEHQKQERKELAKLLEFPSLKVLQLKSIQDAELERTANLVNVLYFLNLSESIQHNIETLEINVKTFYSFFSNPNNYPDIDKLFSTFKNLKNIHIYGYCVDYNSSYQSLDRRDSSTTYSFLKSVPIVLKAIFKNCNQLISVRFHLQLDYHHQDQNYNHSKAREIKEAELECFKYRESISKLDHFEFVCSLNKNPLMWIPSILH